VLTYHIRRVGIERAQGGLGSAMAVTLMLALIVAIALLFAFARSGRRMSDRNCRPPTAFEGPRFKATPASALLVLLIIVVAVSPRSRWSG
jgi:hypothetical protein